MKIAPLLGHDVSVCIDPLADLSSTPNWIWCRLRMEVVGGGSWRALTGRGTWGVGRQVYGYQIRAMGRV